MHVTINGHQLDNITILEEGGACERKVKYTKEGAERIATMLGINAYKCEFCPAWHTSKSKVSKNKHIIKIRKEDKLGKQTMRNMACLIIEKMTCLVKLPGVMDLHSLNEKQIIQMASRNEIHIFAVKGSYIRAPWTRADGSRLASFKEFPIIVKNKKTIHDVNNPAIVSLQLDWFEKTKKGEPEPAPEQVPAPAPVFEKIFDYRATEATPVIPAPEPVLVQDNTDYKKIVTDIWDHLTAGKSTDYVLGYLEGRLDRK